MLIACSDKLTLYDTNSEDSKPLKEFKQADDLNDNISEIITYCTFNHNGIFLLLKIK